MLNVKQRSYYSKDDNYGSFLFNLKLKIAAKLNASANYNETNTLVAEPVFLLGKYLKSLLKFVSNLGKQDRNIQR